MNCLGQATTETLDADFALAGSVFVCSLCVLSVLFALCACQAVIYASSPPRVLREFAAAWHHINCFDKETLSFYFVVGRDLRDDAAAWHHYKHSKKADS